MEKPNIRDIIGDALLIVLSGYMAWKTIDEVTGGKLSAGIRGRIEVFRTDFAEYAELVRDDKHRLFDIFYWNSRYENSPDTPEDGERVREV
jgi:hypothetical protein